MTCPPGPGDASDCTGGPSHNSECLQAWVECGKVVRIGCLRVIFILQLIAFTLLSH